MHADSNIFVLTISQRIHRATQPKDHDYWNVMLKSNTPYQSPLSRILKSLSNPKLIYRCYPRIYVLKHKSKCSKRKNIGTRGVYQHWEISHSWNSCSDMAFRMSISHTGGEAKTSLWDYPEHTRVQVEYYSWMNAASSLCEMEDYLKACGGN